MANNATITYKYYVVDSSTATPASNASPIATSTVGVTVVNGKTATASVSITVPEYRGKYLYVSAGLTSVVSGAWFNNSADEKNAHSGQIAQASASFSTVSSLTTSINSGVQSFYVTIVDPDGGALASSFSTTISSNNTNILFCDTQTGTFAQSKTINLTQTTDASGNKTSTHRAVVYYKANSYSSTSATVTIGCADTKSSNPDYSFTNINITATINAYVATVTYYGNDNTGGSTSSQQVTYGGAWSTQANGFTRTGYSFSYWYTNSSGSGGTKYNASTSQGNSSLTSNLSLYAIWTINQYYLDLNGYLESTTIGTYSSVGNISGSGTADVYVGGTLRSNDCTDYYTQWNYNTSYQITDIKPSSGWTYDGIMSGSYGVSGNIPAVNCGVYLQFHRNIYTVTVYPYDDDGDDALTTFYYKYGANNGTYYFFTSSACTSGGISSISTSSSQVTGYTFNGWVNGSTTYISSSGTISTSLNSHIGNISLFGSYTANTYTVTYKANGSGESDVTQTVTYEQEWTTKARTTFTRSGYYLTYWYTTSSGSGGTLYYCNNTKYWYSTQGLTLYAIWVKLYYITFNANGGSGSVPSTVTFYGETDSEDINDEVPTRSYYNFYGWSNTSSWNSYRLCQNESSGGSEAPDGTTASITCDDGDWTFSEYWSNLNATQGSNTTLALYAQWYGIKYTLTIDKPYSTGGTASVSFYYGTTTPASTISLPTFYSDGYVVSFNVNGGSGTVSDITAVDYASCAGVYSSLTGGTVLYNSSGSRTSNLTSTTYHANSTIYALANNYTDGTITLPAYPTAPTGYYGLGWYTSSGTKVGVAGGSYTPSEDITLKMMWGANTYYVYYYPNGGSGSTTSQGVSYNSSWTTKGRIFSYTGKTMSSWNTNSGGTGTTYSISTSQGTWSRTSALSLYAIWKWSTYNVYYDNYQNNSFLSETSQTVTYNSTWTTKPSSTFSRTGWTLSSWEDDDEGTNYNCNETQSAWDVEYSRYLRPMWTVNNYYIYYYNYNKSGTYVGSTYTYLSYTDKWTTKSSSTFSYTGYTLTGWSTSVNGSKVYDCNSDRGKYLTAYNTSLYTVWTPNTYYVYYYPNGGSGSTTTQSVTYGSSWTTKGEIFSKTGNTLSSWNTNSSGTGTTYSLSTNQGTWSRTSALSLYAKWTPNSYTVTYINTNDNSTSTQSVTYGSTWTTKASNTFTRSGYTNSYWYTTSTGSGGTVYNCNTNQGTWSRTSGLTLYTHWVAGTYTLNFYDIFDYNTSYTVSATADAYYTLPSQATVGWSRSGYVLYSWEQSSTEEDFVIYNQTSLPQVYIGSNETFYGKWAVTRTITLFYPNSTYGYDASHTISVVVLNNSSFNYSQIVSWYGSNVPPSSYTYDNATYTFNSYRAYADNGYVFANVTSSNTTFNTTQDLTIYPFYTSSVNSRTITVYYSYCTVSNNGSQYHTYSQTSTDYSVAVGSIWSPNAVPDNGYYLKGYFTTSYYSASTKLSYDITVTNSTPPSTVYVLTGTFSQNWITDINFVCTDSTDSATYDYYYTNNYTWECYIYGEENDGLDAYVSGCIDLSSYTLMDQWTAHFYCNSLSEEDYDLGYVYTSTSRSFPTSNSDCLISDVSGIEALDDDYVSLYWSSNKKLYFTLRYTKDDSTSEALDYMHFTIELMGYIPNET